MAMLIQPGRKYTRQMALADALMQQSINTAPVESHLQGLARLGQMLAGKYRESRAQGEEDERQARGRAELGAALGAQNPYQMLGQSEFPELQMMGAQGALQERSGIAVAKAKADAAAAADKLKAAQSPFGTGLEGNMWKFYQAGPTDPNYGAAVAYLSKPRYVTTPAGTVIQPAAISPDGKLVTGGAQVPQGQPSPQTAGGFIPGTDPASVEAAKKDVARVAKMEEIYPKARDALSDLERQTEIVTGTIDKALDVAAPMNPETGKREPSMWATGMGNYALANLPNTDARALNNYLNTIKANIGFDKLQAMRANSPTGGALGNVSEMENKLLQAVNGALDPLQADQLVKNLQAIRDLYPRVLAERKAAFETDYGQFMGGQKSQATPAGAQAGKRPQEMTDDEILRALGQ